jgi:glycosyltransferase involved in cell wall biosynthesis
LVEKKGVDSLIRAVATLPVDVRLTIAGDGPQRAQLERLTRNLGVGDRIEFLGSVTNEQVRELLQDCDAFALACRVDRNGDKDGIPVVLMEAMACGVPVLAGDLPAIRELVVDGRTGRLVDGNDVSAIATALVELVGGGDRVRAMAEQGRAHVVAEFSLSANVDRLEAALERAIRARRSTVRARTWAGLRPW